MILTAGTKGDSLGCGLHVEDAHHVIVQSDNTVVGAVDEGAIFGPKTLC